MAPNKVMRTFSSRVSAMPSPGTLLIVTLAATTGTSGDGELRERFFVALRFPEPIFALRTIGRYQLSR